MINLLTVEEHRKGACGLKKLRSYTALTLNKHVPQLYVADNLFKWVGN